MNRVASVLVGLATAALLASGCGGPSLEGEWDAYINGAGASTVTVHLSLMADATYSSAAEFGMGASGPPFANCIFTTTVNGTWSSTDTQITFGATDGTEARTNCDDTASNGTDTLDSVMLEDYKGTATYEFENEDSLEITDSTGLTVTYIRAK